MMMIIQNHKHVVGVILLCSHGHRLNANLYQQMHLVLYSHCQNELDIDLSGDNNSIEESEFPKLVSFEMKGIQVFFSGIP